MLASGNQRRGFRGGVRSPPHQVPSAGCIWREKPRWTIGRFWAWQWALLTTLRSAQPGDSSRGRGCSEPGLGLGSAGQGDPGIPTSRNTPAFGPQPVGDECCPGGRHSWGSFRETLVVCLGARVGVHTHFQCDLLFPAAGSRWGTFPLSFPSGSPFYVADSFPQSKYINMDGLHFPLEVCFR